MMTNKMMVSNIEIEVQKKKIKNMYLSVLPPDGKVRMSVPVHAKDEVIKLFAITKIDWIKKQIHKFKKLEHPAEPEYISGENHCIWGKPYRIEIRHNYKNGVELNGNKLLLTVRKSSTKEQRERVIVEWYREQLKKELPTLIEKWENIIGVKANFVGVKNMRTRWGSCNVNDKRVWVSLQLAKKPFHCLEYIVVHELVHLLEKNHSNVFWGYMDKFFPDWRAVKAELNGFM
ncbi:MAG: SprT family zinc-dependent metalloprotease [Peptostreptococcales bacterium]|jgi:predicted metal-dependent hydrolase